MSETIRLQPCPKCHAPIPVEAPQGLCPRCVLAGAAAPTEGGHSIGTAEIPSLERVAAAFPNLEIFELIGRGGMGFVYKARQPHLDRLVALKLLPEKLAKDPRFAERFNREGRFLAKLSHPNIVSVFDFGQADGICFLMMEYVDGVNLRQAMRAGRFSPAEALSIVPRICEALQFAHEQGVLHRDIKPENILLDARGRVKIADFGIAKLVGENSGALTLTGTGATLGTPHYMAPEQIERPDQIDHRADIYSLGVVFYEMLTGEVPMGRFAPPSARTPLDERVDEIVMRALERERELRQKNATELRTQVEDITAHPSQGISRSIGGRTQGDPSAVTPIRRAARALLAIGIVNWVGGVLLMGLLALTPLGRNLQFSETQLAVAGVLLLLCSGGIVLGAGRMMSLRSYRLALVSSVLAMASGPGSLVGLPIGIWSLVVLLRPSSRALFQEQWATETVPPTQPQPGGQAEDLPRWSAGAFSSTRLWVGIRIATWMVAILCVGNFLLPHVTQLGNSPGKTVTVGLSQPWLVDLPLVSDGGEVRREVRLNFGSGAFASGVLGTVLLIVLVLWRAAHVGAKSFRGLPAVLTALVVSGFAVLLLSALTARQHGRAPQRKSAALAGSGVREGSLETNAWIRFTFTAVELREVGSQRWLTFDFVDDVHGNCERAFSSREDIEGFTNQMRATSFATSAKGGSPAVRHQRVEFLMPGVAEKGELLRFRDSLAKRMVARSIVVPVGDEELLFSLSLPEHGQVSAYIGSVTNRPVAKERNEEFDRMIIQAAQQNVEAMKKRQAAGIASQTDLAVAERELAVAEARGDAIAIARAQLRFTETMLGLARQQQQVGVISQADLRKAEAEHAVAVAEARGDKSGVAKANASYAEFALAQARRQFEAGVIPESRVRRAELDYAMALSELKRVRDNGTAP